MKLSVNHGTVTSYRKGCRCDSCCDAKSREHAEYRARKAAGIRSVPGRRKIPLSERPHGNYTTYCKGCRCDPCTTANTEYGRRQRVEPVRALLVEAIQQWMRVPTSEMQYAHGNAQGIARALAALRSTTFSIEWEAGLDRYQNWITVGDQ